MYNENNNQDWIRDEYYTECRVVEPEKEKKKSGKKAAKVIAGVLCAALLAGGGFAAGSYMNRPEAAQEALIQQNESSSAKDYPVTSADAAQPVGNLIVTADKEQNGKVVYTPAQIAQKYLSSVVAITSKSTEEVYSIFGGMREYESEGAGSGIIVAKTDEELIIATNNHVVENSKELSVCFNDDEEQIYSAYIKGTDPSNDLAVVAIKLSDIPEKVLNTLTVAVLGDSDECVMGEQVVAIGNALGYGQSLTSGYISALDRVVTVDNVTYTLIQTDAAINPGNSGGALFNMYGEVIGINSVKFASENVEGMGFAIPISKAIPILDSLAAREVRDVVAESERGYIGISGVDVTSSAADYYNMPVGAYVSTIESGSAAEKAGMRQADIIVAFDGVAVSGMTQLKNCLQYYAAGETVEVTVKRLSSGKYEEIKLTLTLGERPAQSQENTQESTQGGISDNSRNGFNSGNNFGFYWGR